MQKMLGEWVRMILYVVLVLYTTYWGYLLFMDVIPTLQRIANGLKNELNLQIEMSNIHNKISKLKNTEDFEDTEDEEMIFAEFNEY